MQTFQQYGNIPTRKQNILDLCYGNITDGLRALSYSPLWLADHRIRIRIPLFVPQKGHSVQRSVIFVLHGVYPQPVSLFQFLLLCLCYTARSVGVFPSSLCFSGAPVYFHKLNKTDWCTNRVSESRAPVSTAQLGFGEKMGGWEPANQTLFTQSLYPIRVQINTNTHSTNQFLSKRLFLPSVKSWQVCVLRLSFVSYIYRIYL